MRTTLVLPETLAGELAEAARHPLETAGVVLAVLHDAPDGERRLLGLEVRWVPADAYIERKGDALTMASHGYVPALGEAERRGAVAVWFHTHPGTAGIPLPSSYDVQVDAQLRDVFSLRTGSGYYGTLILSPRDNGGIAFSGALQADDGACTRIERLWIVGDSWRLIRAEDAPGTAIAAIYDRNVRAFGPRIQGTLGDLRIGVVGAGGTGSAVCEQLVRLGVRKLLLIDGDVLSESNVTRVYGSTPAAVGQPKVDVLRRHLSGITPDLDCTVAQSMITLQPTAKMLASCDLVFGCSDDNAGRLVLSRLASYLLAPVIDMGILLSSDGQGILTGIDGRVTILSPESACLVCRNRIDLARAASELRTPEERQRLEAEGYAPALGGIEPAVVTFTTAVAAAAVSELLERLIGFGATPRPSEILLRWHEREISTNVAAPRPGHYCAKASGKWGMANTQPFLEQVWPGP